jgi:hypothetical protein
MIFPMSPNARGVIESNTAGLTKVSLGGRAVSS